MKLSDMKVLLIGLFIAGIIWFIIRNKEEKKTTNVRPYTKTITVKGHSRSKPKANRKKRRSGKR